MAGMSPGLVVDASVVLAWALPEETRADQARAFMLHIAERSALVPALWRLEVGNALLIAERRGRVQPDRVEAICRHLAALPIAVDPETGLRAWTATAALARRHGLTLYDACYLELAVRRSLPLATFDAALAGAAAAERVTVGIALPRDA